MKSLFLPVIFLGSFFALSGHAQNRSVDTLPDQDVARRWSLRTSTSNFTRTLHRMGEPSIASFFMTDFTFNTDPDLQKKPYVLNATIQPILSLGGKRWHVGRYIHSLQITPSMMVRVLENDSLKNDHSLPVRTPGLIVKVNYLYSHEKFWNDSNRTKWYMGVGGFHHSNGQDGYEFQSDSSINTYNGNFSEALAFEIIIGGIKTYRRNTGVESEKIKGLRHIQKNAETSFLYWKAGYEYHPGFGTSPRFLQYNIYGRKRLNLQLGYIYAPGVRDLVRKKGGGWSAYGQSFKTRELRRFIFNFSYIMDAVYNTGKTHQLERVSFLNAGKRLNVDLTWYERLGTDIDYAFFLRAGYYGSDPYNIYFQQSLWVVRFGVAYGVFAFGEGKSRG